MIFEDVKIVVLDACVLYSAPIRDLLLHLSAEKQFRVKWSKQIHTEWNRNLLLNRLDLQKSSLDKTILAMNKAFPDASVNHFEKIINKIELPDPNDRHVVAVAIKSAANLIITFNLKDFPNEYMKRYGVKAVHPDNFIENLLFLNERAVLKALENQVNMLRNPSLTTEQVLESLKKCGIPKSVRVIKKILLQ